MVNEKGNALIIGIFIGTIITAGAFYVYNLTSQKDNKIEVIEQLPTQPPPPPVESSAKPLVPLSAEETTDWKTYSFPEFGYSFKAPVNYLVDVRKPESTDTFVQYVYLQTHTPPDSDSISIGVEPSDSLEEGLKYDKVSRSNKQELVINNLTWTKFDAYTYQESVMYVIYKNGNMYAIDGSVRNSDRIFEIVSTFTFLDKSVAN